MGRATLGETEYFRGPHSVKAGNSKDLGYFKKVIPKSGLLRYNLSFKCSAWDLTNIRNYVNIPLPNREHLSYEMNYDPSKFICLHPYETRTVKHKTHLLATRSL